MLGSSNISTILFKLNDIRFCICSILYWKREGEDSKRFINPSQDILGLYNVREIILNKFLYKIFHL